MGELYNIDLTIEVEADSIIEAADKLAVIFQGHDNVDLIFSKNVDTQLFGELGVEYD